ncbi:TonB-dependent siderophore receptor [Opitutus terrae]|uniref:TonB-dependent siderophore receptor n=1 Tax=Opitutus terrae TaxID=107709 RepID=UPI000305B322|nr:TonB-dependent receptor [Opitutus terrae]
MLALAALCSVAVQAQTTAPATATPAADDDEVVKLDAFTVSTDRDVGYRATNSIAGTRTNTPIKDVPLNIQVFTKDLAEDLLIKNQVQFETYNASLVAGGIDVFSDNHIQQPYEQFLYRGFKQNWGLRDGVREYDPVDSQGLARVEVVKGPAAALYGLAYPGGIMQNISKTVELEKNFTSLRLTGGMYGDYRATADINATGTIAGQKIGVRFNGAYEKTEDNREHSQGDVRLLNVAVAWQPTATTKLEFMAEDGYRAKPNGLGYFLTGEAGAANNQAQIPLQILNPSIDWDWNWANDNNLNVLETKRYKGTVTQQIGEDVTVQAYLQYSRRLEIPGNGWDASGSGGANAWESASSGWDQATNTIRSTYNYRDWGNQMHAYGATAVYKLNFEQIKNTFAFGANVWKEDELSRHSAPLNPLASALVYPVQMGVPINVPPFPPADLQPDLTGGNGYHHEDNSNDYYFVNWQASMFNDRLKTNIGVNKTNLKTIAWDNGVDTEPNVYTASKYSPLFGAVFAVTKEISVFAVRSTSLFPDSTKDSFGNQFSPQVGLGYEGGVKVDLLDGKISGTISYFVIQQTGGTQNDPTKENRNTVRFDSLTPEQRQIEFGGVRPLGDIVQGGEQESKGFEMDLTFQPLRQWQIVTSYSNVNHEFTKSALPATIGQTNPQAIKNSFAVISKYSFLDGELKGLAVGGGLRWWDKSLQDYQRRAPNGGVYSGTGDFIDVARYSPSRTWAELFATYRWKVWGQNVMLQFNAQNILRADSYVGWKATGSADKLAVDRYKVPTPIVYRLTFGLDF